MFRRLLDGISHLEQITRSAFGDWNVENWEGCLERLKELAEDAQTFAKQAQSAYEEAKRQL